MRMNNRVTASFVATMLALTIGNRICSAIETESPSIPCSMGSRIEDGDYHYVYVFVVSWIEENKDVLYVSHDSMLGADLGMDSMDMLNITEALENEFDVALTTIGYYRAILGSFWNVSVADFSWIVYSFVATERLLFPRGL